MNKKKKLYIPQQDHNLNMKNLGMNHITAKISHTTQEYSEERPFLRPLYPLPSKPPEHSFIWMETDTPLPSRPPI